MCWVSHALCSPLQYLLLVRDEMTVSHKHLGEFCSSLKQYLKSVAGERDCFQWVPRGGCLGTGLWGGGSSGGLGARSWAAEATPQRTRAGDALWGAPSAAPPPGLTPLPTTTSVTAVKLPDGVTFIVYEFWETEEDWKR